jgi:transposase
MTTTSFPIELGIEGLEVVEVKLTRDGHYEIYVKSTLQGCNCHKCGKHTTKFHGKDRQKRIRHLPILGRETYLIIILPRFQCLDCDGEPTTTQQVPWHERRSPNTIPFEKHILLGLMGSTVEDVSLREGIGYEAVMGIVRRHIRSEVDWNSIKHIGRIGLDEISLKKGHKDFVTIVSAYIDGHVQLLAVLKDRRKDTVKDFLETIPDDLKSTVKSVCTDMYDGFINAAKEVFGKRTRIVVDRFHVAKLYRKGLDTLRIKELKRLKEELSEEEYAELKGAMWVLRKKKEDLTAENKALLKLLFGYSPSLKTAYQLRNDLTKIFNTKTSRSGGKRRINNWIVRVNASGITCYDKFISTLNSYMEEIVNYFIDRHSSGFVEGFNNKIKVIKRRCYGILNIDHLFQRIFLDISEREIYAL